MNPSIGGRRRGYRGRSRVVSLAAFDDPDDYRPHSELAMMIDPARSTGEFVRGLTVFYERIAPGDRISRHEHTMEEVLFLDAEPAPPAAVDVRELLEGDPAKAVREVDAKEFSTRDA